MSYRDCELGLLDDYRGRVTASWGSGRYIEGKWMTHVTLGGRIVYPSLVFAGAVLADPARHARFVDQAKRQVEVARAVVHKYDEDFVLFPEPGERYYHMPLKGGEVDTLNHVNSLVNAHIAVWELTGDTVSRDIAVQCCKVFKDTLTVLPNGAFSWPIRPKWTAHRNNRHPERIWKAQVSSLTALVA